MFVSARLDHHQVTELSAGGNLAVTAKTGDVALEATKLASVGTTMISAEDGLVGMLSVTDSDFKSVQQSGSNLFWRSMAGKGHDDTTVSMVTIDAGGGLTVTAGDGVVIEYKDGKANLTETVDRLRQEPGLAWLKEMQARNDVAWNAVAEAHKSWDYKSQGLSGPAAAMIVIAVMVATNGAGAWTLGATTSVPTSVATVSAAGVVGTAPTTAAVMANAAMSSLIAQASISMINNGGNLGAVFKELGSSSALVKLATATVAAGLLNEIGTMTDGHFGQNGLTTGQDLTPGQYFGTENYFLNVAGHAVVGCAQSAATGGDCGSGAIAGAVSGATGPFYVGQGVWGGTALAATTGGIGSVVAGGDFAEGAIIGGYGFLYNGFGGSFFGMTGENQGGIAVLANAQSRLAEAKAATEPVFYVGWREGSSW